MDNHSAIAGSRPASSRICNFEPIHFSLPAIRCGLAKINESLAALAKVEELDPTGRLGSSSPRQVVMGPRGDAVVMFPNAE